MKPSYENLIKGCGLSLFCNSEHVTSGESSGGGSFVFSSRNCKPPPWVGRSCMPSRALICSVPLHLGQGALCLCIYVLLTASISNPSSGVRVSTAVDLSSAFPPAHRVFSTPCGFSCCGVYACLQTREREHWPGGWCSLGM